MADVLNSLRLVGIGGTNKVMAGELSRLCKRAFDDVRLDRPKKAGSGCLIYPFDARVAAAATRFHRTASRVLWDLYESSARRLEPLYDELVELVAGDERCWIRTGTFSIRGRNLQDFPAGPGQVVGAVKNAIVDGAKRRGVEMAVDPDAADMEIAVRLHDERLTVSVDLAGRALHIRGYRTGAGEAPLRENLAAVLLMLARFDPRRAVLLDPMAGSGTIGIEAALMARGCPTSSTKTLIDTLPIFTDLNVPCEPLFADSKPVVLVNDIDTRRIANARANVAAAGVDGDVSCLHGDLRDLHPARIDKELASRGRDRSSGGLIITNPPYGIRLNDDELLSLYADLGDWCRQFPGWRAAFLVANRDFESAAGFRARIKKPLRNAGLPAQFLLVDL
jgi:23S rRNA G2445 N2-methylase RlmL